MYMYYVLLFFKKAAAAVEFIYAWALLKKQKKNKKKREVVCWLSRVIEGGSSATKSKHFENNIWLQALLVVRQ
jgi:hypothetical protein